MISQEKFIASVKGKKVKIQEKFVKILRYFNKLMPYTFKVNNSFITDYVYVTICRSTDFDMVLASVYTLYKNSKICPSKIIVVSDGSWEISEGNAFFNKYNINVETIMWNICASYYSQTCPNLQKWAESHIWGKKMAAILYFSEKNKVLFSDPDILWYNTPLTKNELENCKLKLSIDNSHNYDDVFIRNYGYESLYNTKEPINCGAVFISGGLSLLSDKALECIDYESTHFGRFAEQTVFAIMDLEYSCRWSMEQITSEISDLLYPFTAKTIFYKNMIARHYLWRLKWIYWKDLTKQRFFK